MARKKAVAIPPPPKVIGTLKALCVCCGGPLGEMHSAIASTLANMLPTKCPYFALSRRGQSSLGRQNEEASAATSGWDALTQLSIERTTCFCGRCADVAVLQWETTPGTLVGRGRGALTTAADPSEADRPTQWVTVVIVTQDSVRAVVADAQTTATLAALFPRPVGNANSNRTTGEGSGSKVIRHVNVVLWISPRHTLASARSKRWLPFDDIVVQLLVDGDIQSVELASEEEVVDYVSSAMEASTSKRSVAPPRPKSTKLPGLSEQANLWANQLAQVREVSQKLAQGITAHIDCMESMVEFFEERPDPASAADLVVRENAKGARMLLGKPLSQRLHCLYSAGAAPGKLMYH